jgi:hypothetical protein
MQFFGRHAVLDGEYGMEDAAGVTANLFFPRASSSSGRWGNDIGVRGFGVPPLPQELE